MFSRILACGLLAMLVGCSTNAVGEFGAACSNGRDDDGDHLIDCDDADCFGAEYCRDGGLLPKLTPPSTNMDAGPIDAGARVKKPEASVPLDAGRKRDASTLPEAAAMPESDAGDELDGGSTVPTCNPGCMPNEECVSDATSSARCVVVAANQGGDFILSIGLVDAPNTDETGACTDCIGFIPLCGAPDCVVDPFVIAWLTSGSTTTMVLKTNPQINNTAPDFSADRTARVTIKGGDLLTLEVRDYDETSGGDTSLYSCKPDLDVIPGPIQCSRWRYFPPQLQTINAHLDQAP